MNIRDARKADKQACGRILYDAFKKLADQHNFPPDFPWCLNRNLKLVFQMTQMSTGLHHEPAGAYLPSILY